MNYTFKMSGGLGDLVYAMPAMRGLGGGTLAICPSPFTDNALHSGNTRAMAEQFEQAKSFFLEAAQGQYVHAVDVLEHEVPARYDLNRFRLRPSLIGPPTLAEMILETLGLKPFLARHSWLELPSISSTSGEVIIHRTLRYQNPAFPWREIIEGYSPKTYFVGTSEEHAVFCNEFGFVPWRPTATLLSLAKVIGESQLFIGNQSVGYAIAEGLKHPAILEQCDACPNCNFERDTALVNPTVSQLPHL